MSLSGSTTMDANLKKLLEELPNKPPRSRLEPYLEFIEELRIKGRTYRDIAEILAEKCGVRVTGSGIHDFLQSRSRAKATPVESKPIKTTQFLIGNPVAPDIPAAVLSKEEVARRIAALKARNTQEKPSDRRFEYDPEEPLRLERSKGD